MKENRFSRLVKPFLAQREPAVDQYQKSGNLVIVLFLVICLAYLRFKMMGFQRDLCQLSSVSSLVYKQLTVVHRTVCVRL